MTVEQRVTFLEMSQKISIINKDLLEAVTSISDNNNEVEDLLQASAKLIQAQNNLMKAVSK